MNRQSLYHRHLEAKRRDLVETALRASGGNVAKAARVLELQRSYLWKLIRDLGVDVGAFR